MATLSQVQLALQTMVTNAVYPNGINNPSVAGVGIRIELGWPIPGDLDTRLGAGKALVSIFQPEGMEKNTTRFFPQWQTLITNIANLTLTVSGNTITVGGSIVANEIAVVILNKNTASPYAYTVQSTDTLNSVASALAALIPNASAVNNVITVNNSYSLVARVSTQSTALREEKRQNRVFWLIVWAPTPTIRDQIGDAIDLAIPLNPYIALADQTGARVIYKGQATKDQFAKTSAYRRDFSVEVEYATTQTAIYDTIENIDTPTTVVESIT